MYEANSEKVSHAWRPEFMETVEKSAVSITDSPEPKRGQEMNEVLLRQVSIFFILSKQLSKHKSTVKSNSNNASKHN